MNNKSNININIHTKFLLSTSGSNSSIAKHNKALEKLGINLAYFTFEDNIDPKTYVTILKSPFIKGGAVTGKGGLKSSIIPFLDVTEPLAQKTLAVNTVVNKNGKLFGYNTDAFGLKKSLENGIKKTNIEIKTAVIYGNGGVSGVAFKVLQDMGIDVTIVGRNMQKVARKKHELGIDNIPHFEGPYNLVVDATPISSSPKIGDNQQFLDLVDNCEIVFCHNMPEKDHKTNYLLKYCNDNNIFYIAGKDMYVAQLIKQYNLYFEGITNGNGEIITEEDIIQAWDL